MFDNLKLTQQEVTQFQPVLMQLDGGVGTHTYEDICKTVSEQVKQDLL